MEDQVKEANELRQLAETQHAFTQWRLGSKRGQKIPEELWTKALALLDYFTVSKTAKSLKLNSFTLRKRAIEAGIKQKAPKSKASKSKAKKAQETSTFIQVELPDKSDMKQVGPMTAAGEWRLIFTRADGGRLEIIPPHFDDHRMASLIRDWQGA